MNSEIENDGLGLKGIWNVKIIDREGNCRDEFEAKNVVTAEGILHLLDVGIGAKTKSSNYYVGLNGTVDIPTSSSTYAVPGFTEEEDYAETSRELWDVDSAATGAITNSTPAEFNIDTDSTNVYGGFICDNATKGDTAASGAVLLAALNFGSVKVVDNGEKIQIQYTITMTSS